MLEILLLSLSLSMDAFAISIALSVSKQCQSIKRMAVAAGSFAFFQFLFFMTGVGLGSVAMNFLSSAGKWAAFVLLLFIGGKMIKEGFEKCEDEEAEVDGYFGKGHAFFASVLLLSVADSIDAGAAGLGVSLSSDKSLLFTAVVIGIVTLIISGIGFAFGRKLGENFGKKSEIFGGVVLIAIGIKIAFF
ncbi:putative manganese efflux pump MntP [Fibrobacterales bacterium]|nr:putative manganese efflux pump MntP [Fibrobacterales bacterium]